MSEIENFLRLTTNEIMECFEKHCEFEENIIYNGIKKICKFFYFVDYKEDNRFEDYRRIDDLSIFDNIELDKINPFIAARVYHYLSNINIEKYKNSQKAFDKYVEAVAEENNIDMNLSLIFSAYSIYISFGKQFDLSQLKKKHITLKDRVENLNDAYEVNYYKLSLEEKIFDIDELLYIFIDKLNNIEPTSVFYSEYLKLINLVLLEKKNNNIITNEIYNSEIKRFKLLKADRLVLKYSKMENAMISITALKEAINIYKECNELKSENLQVALEFLDKAQKEMVNNLTKFEVSSDLSEFIKEIDSRLCKFDEEKSAVFFIKFMKHLQYSNEVKNMKNNLSITGQIMEKELVDDLGKTIVKIPAYKDEPNIIFQYTIFNCHNKLQLFGQYVYIVLKKIKNKYPNIEEYLIDLISNTYLLSEGGKRIVSKGISYFVNDKFEEAFSLIIPQVEASVRRLSSLVNTPISKVNPDGTEDYNTLSSILDNDIFRDSIDEDIIFNLKLFFDNKIGLNLRNNFSHGLIDFFGAYEFFYAFWFYLVFLNIYS